MIVSNIFVQAVPDRIYRIYKIGFTGLFIL